MDKRLKEALDFSNFRMILSTRQKNLKVLMDNKLLLSYKNNIFRIDKELISFVHLLVAGGDERFVFIDINDIPILITDLPEFGKKALKRYKSVLESYYESYQKLSEAREIRKVIDWDEEK